MQQEQAVKKAKRYLLIIPVLSILGYLLAQSLEEQKVDLEDRIDDRKKELTEAKQYFEEYKQDQEDLIEQKQEELSGIEKEVRGYENEIAQLRRQIQNYDLRIAAVNKKNAAINQSIKSIANGLITEMETGIPFNRDQRISTLKSLVLDIEGGKADASESFTRLLAFLNSEELLAYDSQTMERSVEVDGETLKATLIRIGRVFFAADTGEKVFLYKEINGEYVLDVKNPLSINERRAVRSAMKIIQGKEAPEMTPLPFNMENANKVEGE